MSGGHHFSMSAQLNASCFFAGSFVYCEVRVRSDGFFLLEAGVHGVVRSSDKWVSGRVDRFPAVTGRAADAGYGDCGTLLACASPTVLGCEIQSDDIRDHHYLFYCQLPHELAPSFRGQAYKYIYFVSVAAQVGHEHRVLKVPFRVLRKSRVEGIHLEDALLEPLKMGRAYGPVHLSHPDDVFGFVELEDETARSRILLARAQDDEVEPVEWALVVPPHHCPRTRDPDYSREMAEQRAARFFERAHALKRSYQIQSKKHIVVEWRMKHSMLYIESSVEGTFDFRSGQVRCHRLHVALLRREIVRDPGANNGSSVSLDHVVDERDHDVLNALEFPVALYFPDTSKRLARDTYQSAGCLASSFCVSATQGQKIKTARTRLKAKSTDLMQRSWTRFNGSWTFQSLWVQKFRTNCALNPLFITWNWM